MFNTIGFLILNPIALLLIFMLIQVYAMKGLTLLTLLPIAEWINHYRMECRLKSPAVAGLTVFYYFVNTHV